MKPSVTKAMQDQIKGSKLLVQLQDKYQKQLAVLNEIKDKITQKSNGRFAEAPEND